MADLLVIFEEEFPIIGFNLLQGFLEHLCLL